MKSLILNYKKLIMKKILFFFTTACLLVLSSCSEKPTVKANPEFSIDSVKTAIAASNKTYSESFDKKDSVAFRDHYTTDGCIFAGNMPRLCGTPGIMGFFNGSLAMGISSLNLTTEEVIGNADAVSEVGMYELKGAAGASLDKGKYIVIWKNVDGKWKMHRDIFNSDMPPPPTPTKK